MILKVISGFALLAGVGSSGTSPAPLKQLQIELVESAAVKGTQFALGEVVKVSGADAELVAKAEKISVGYAPAPGFQRRLLRSSIGDLLMGAGIEKKDVQITGAVYVSVQSESRFIEAERILQEGDAWVRAQLRGLGIEEDYQIEPKAKPLALQVPVGKQGVRIEPVLRGEFRDRGQVNLDVHVLVDGEIYASVPLLMNVSRFASAAVASRLIQPNESMDSSNVVFQKVKLPEGNSEPILSQGELQSRKSGRIIRAGEVLTQSMLRVVPLVVKDQEVIVLAKSGALTVTMRGIAKKDGFFGAIIPVENAESQQTFQARVTAQGRVEVQTSGSQSQ